MGVKSPFRWDNDPRLPPGIKWSDDPRIREEQYQRHLSAAAEMSDWIDSDDEGIDPSVLTGVPAHLRDQWYASMNVRGIIVKVPVIGDTGVSRTTMFETQPKPKVLKKTKSTRPESVKRMPASDTSDSNSNLIDLAVPHISTVAIPTMSLELANIRQALPVIPPPPIPPRLTISRR